MFRRNALLIFVVLLAQNLFSLGFSYNNTGIASERLAFKVIKNPSLLGYDPSVSILAYADHNDEKINGNGLYFAFNTLGFGYAKDMNDKEYYIISSGSKTTDGVYFGSALRWFNTDMDPEYDLSLTLRPAKYLSIAGNVHNLFQANSNNITTDAGIAYRPLSNTKLQLLADISFIDDKIDQSFYNIGLSSEIMDGITLSAGYANSMVENSDPVYSLAINFSSGLTNLGTTSTIYDNADMNSYNTYFQVSNLKGPKFIKLKNSKMIEIILEGEYKEEIPKENFLSSMIGKKGKTTRNLINVINKYQDDPEIAGILLKTKNYSMTFAQREELRDALKDFKNNGKKIITYFISSSQSNYFLTSVSDKIFMYPEGEIQLAGIGIEMMFFRNILDKLGIKAQIIRHGKFKAAVEPFMLDKASDENVEQLDKYLTILDDYLKNNISEGRNISIEKLNEIFDTVPYHTAASAKEFNLIDDFFPENKLEDKIKEVMGKKVKIIPSKDHLIALNEKDIWKSIGQGKIAIVYATGSINTGKSSNGGFLSGSVMGSETTAKLIRKARKDKNVKAIVFRVDSGGGSGLASDIILNELRLAQTENKKPVIVSMGSMAASGGYWISCYADKIFADNTTLTGSIGVFGIIPSFEELATKVGVTTQKIKKNKYAANSFFKDLTPEEIDFTQKLVDDFYDGFIKKVADARNMKVEDVDKIAEGRIWGAEDAKKIGIIDEIGNLNDAVKYAAESVGIKDIDVTDLSIYTKSGQFSISDILTMGVTEKISEIIPVETSTISTVLKLQENNEKILLMLPYDLEIK
ncbi:MAG: signal peptide peptidase SppA [Candidatus Delongbacteria bacterium]|nr:signal peptide peptidase SppA [Candidatus Delongbacteria bacterium]